MKTWPFYKAPSGYRLIDIDYKICFDDSDGLILNWKKYFDVLVKFLSSSGNDKDKKIKGLVEKVRDALDLPENGKNAAIFWALHGYFVPTKLIVVKKHGKKINTRYTIKDSQESFIFMGKSQQNVKDHILHMKSMKTSIQPFICCVGEDILNIGNITVYFDDIRYNFKNFIRAVDICFKIIYLFDLEFPPACLTFYSFIECFLYNFKSKNLTSKVHILSDTLKNVLEQGTI
ncbi:hypothetical protein RN001_002721 [Aquatica leii]|uniref:Uncharacterized protein n=1 Tax=Aquatica leii TaxID=1421715 RepID=A0AAN7PDW8_9COLE|nr:hypothetical protein RN001_002721 [Aquatica leii]